MILPLASCGAMGRLVGTAARLPIDIARSAGGMRYDGAADPNIPPPEVMIMLEERGLNHGF